jgi:cysteinyl-tRNA synthetase
MACRLDSQAGPSLDGNMTPELRFYNSLSRTLEKFQPLVPGQVSMYVCGPTVYDDAHLGHARCYITWDVLLRWLRFVGLDVRYARNVTDVDDKILAKARALGQPFRQIATDNLASFRRDMAALHVLPPSVEPEATAYVPQMIATIMRLIDAGYAYAVPDGSVYYRTRRFEAYGCLSHKPLDDLQSGARVDVDPDKEDPLDFALWKGVGPDEPDADCWTSPWGRGRPGWHIECSSMIHAVLGPRIDLHCGGADLMFPHHENEIAQSVPLSDAPEDPRAFVNLWLHNGFVNVGGEKMSKSLGNFTTVARLLTQYDANTIRWFLLTHHYRSPVDFQAEALDGVRNRLLKVAQRLNVLLSSGTLAAAAGVTPPSTWAEAVRCVPDEALQKLLGPMADDLNTPRVLAQWNQLLGQAQTPKDVALLHTGLWLLGFDVPALLAMQPVAVSTPEQLPAALLAPLEALCRQYVTMPAGGSTQPQASLAEHPLLVLLQHRAQAKQAKQWSVADGIRQGLDALGFSLKDVPQGPTSWLWTPKDTMQASEAPAAD